MRVDVWGLDTWKVVKVGLKVVLSKTYTLDLFCFYCAIKIHGLDGEVKRLFR